MSISARIDQMSYCCPPYVETESINSDTAITINSDYDVCCMTCITWCRNDSALPLSDPQKVVKYLCCCVPIMFYVDSYRKLSDTINNSRFTSPEVNGRYKKISDEYEKYYNELVKKSYLQILRNIVCCRCQSEIKDKLDKQKKWILGKIESWVNELKPKSNDKQLTSLSLTQYISITSDDYCTYLEQLLIQEEFIKIAKKLPKQRISSLVSNVIFEKIRIYYKLGDIISENCYNLYSTFKTFTLELSKELSLSIINDELDTYIRNGNFIYKIFNGLFFKLVDVNGMWYDQKLIKSVIKYKYNMYDKLLNNWNDDAKGAPFVLERQILNDDNQVSLYEQNSNILKKTINQVSTDLSNMDVTSDDYKQHIQQTLNVLSEIVKRISNNLFQQTAKSRERKQNIRQDFDRLLWKISNLKTRLSEQNNNDLQIVEDEILYMLRQIDNVDVFIEFERRMCEFFSKYGQSIIEANRSANVNKHIITALDECLASEQLHMINENHKKSLDELVYMELNLPQFKENISKTICTYKHKVHSRRMLCSSICMSLYSLSKLIIILAMVFGTIILLLKNIG
jgi:hypothetical protein